MRKLFFVLFLGIFIFSCRTSTSSVNLKNYKEFLTQKIEHRDSLYILYTIKAWGEQKFWTWAVRTDMYNIKSTEVSYSILGTFYSPDRKKILVWVCEKMPNASSIEKVRPEKESNRICPVGKDTVMNASAIIGFRDSLNKPWQLYPFDRQTGDCSDNKEWLIDLLGNFYFEQMKESQMQRIVQSGDKKGYKELQAFGYNLQDTDFWHRCWLFQKDTVGANNLYPFQLKYYPNRGDEICKKCGILYDLPEIAYPKDILNLFK